MADGGTNYGRYVDMVRRYARLNDLPYQEARKSEEFKQAYQRLKDLRHAEKQTGKSVDTPQFRDALATLGFRPRGADWKLGDTPKFKRR